MNAIVDRSTRQLQAERLQGAEALREARALRYHVFSSEFEARLQGAELGLDMDDFDSYCRHIGVRDLASGELVATTRLLDHLTARQLGRFYSEGEFALHGLAQLDEPVLEIGRTCVAPAYRNGATIAVLWSELAEAQPGRLPLPDGLRQHPHARRRHRATPSCSDCATATSAPSCCIAEPRTPARARAAGQRYRPAAAAAQGLHAHGR